MKQLLPILMVLLFVAGPALAANIFDKPYSWIDNRTQELADPRGDCYSDGGCPSATYCLDAYTVAEHTFIIVDNTTYNITENTFCNTGCSNTLHGCRWDNFTAAIIILLFIAFTGALIYYSPMFGPLGYLIQAIILIGGLAMVTLLDVFASSTWIFVAYTLGAAVFIMWRNFFQKDEESESGDESA